LILGTLLFTDLPKNILPENGKTLRIGNLFHIPKELDDVPVEFDEVLALLNSLTFYFIPFKITA
jgi:hypothetical protein